MRYLKYSDTIFCSPTSFRLIQPMNRHRLPRQNQQLSYAAIILINRDTAIL